MFIQTETTPNDDSLKFIPGVNVMDDGTAEFLDTRYALASSLAIHLLGIGESKLYSSDQTLSWCPRITKTPGL
jgi:Scaffold protein Nfu/NifU N terminal